MTRQEVSRNFIISMERERVRRGYTQPQMAERLGLSTSGYKKIIAGDTNKIDLYSAYQVYQLSGKFIFELCGENSPELEAFQRYRSLTSTQKAFVNDILHFEQDFQDNNSNSREYLSVLVPTGVVEDGMIWDSANIIKVKAASYIHRFSRELHGGILVTSNHLQPVYQMGDILLFTKRPPRNGDTAIVLNREEGRVYLRRYRESASIHLEPLNEYGVTFELENRDLSEQGSWIILGCILTKLRQ
ncbi:MAG: helix-turn-helix domain-containing protein [bacterium]|nr:helix-turn-helix domain-containing protein [bacterium]